MARNFWTCWFYEIRFTWLLIVFMAVFPAVIFGTAFPAMIVLMGSVILGVPTVLAAVLLIKKSAWRTHMIRRVVVMVVIAALTAGAVLQADKLTPTMATPIAKAIESYKQEAGSYPESLAALTPKHLSKLPLVRVALIQPEIVYRLKGGHPYLAVPSAAGDAFSIYEYLFEEERWIHHD